MYASVIDFRFAENTANVGGRVLTCVTYRIRTGGLCNATCLLQAIRIWTQINHNNYVNQEFKRPVVTRHDHLSCTCNDVFNNRLTLSPTEMNEWIRMHVIPLNAEIGTIGMSRIWWKEEFSLSRKYLVVATSSCTCADYNYTVEQSIKHTRSHLLHATTIARPSLSASAYSHASDIFVHFLTHNLCVHTAIANSWCVMISCCVAVFGSDKFKTNTTTFACWVARIECCAAKISNCDWTKCFERNPIILVMMYCHRVTYQLCLQE